MEYKRPAPRCCCPSWLEPSSSAQRPTGVNPSALLNAESSTDTLTNTLLQTTRPVYPINEIQTPNQATTIKIPQSTASQRPLFGSPGKATQISTPQSWAKKTHPHSSSQVHATTSHVAKQSQVDQQLSTPLHADFQSKETFLHRAASQSPSMYKTISKPQSQSSKCPEKQQKNIVTGSFFLRKHTKSAIPDGSQLPSSSIEVPSSVFNRNELRPAAKSNAKVLNETNIEPKEKATQSDDQHLEATNISSSKSETENLTQTLNSPRKKHQLEHIAESGAKPEGTKGIKEMVQKTNHNDHDKKKEIIELQCVALDFRERVKERQHTTVQSEQVQIVNQDNISVPNGRQQKGTIHQPRNKSMVDNSHQHTDIYKRGYKPNCEEKKDVMSKFIPRTVADSRYPRDEGPVSVIILAGKNKGASMVLGPEPSSEKESLMNIDRKYKLNHDRRTEASMRLGLQPSSETESLLHIVRKYKLNPYGKIEAST